MKSDEDGKQSEKIIINFSFISGDLKNVSIIASAMEKGPTEIPNQINIHKLIVCNRIGVTYLHVDTQLHHNGTKYYECGSESHIQMRSPEHSLDFCVTYFPEDINDRTIVECMETEWDMVSGEEMLKIPHMHKLSRPIIVFNSSSLLRIWIENVYCQVTATEVTRQKPD